MADLADESMERLRRLAVELVRSGQTSDATAVLVGIGAVGMMAASTGEPQPAARTPEPPAAEQPAPQTEELPPEPAPYQSF